ncbi:unnamed protein product, partial [Linum tenue]
ASTIIAPPPAGSSSSTLVSQAPSSSPPAARECRRKPLLSLARPSDAFPGGDLFFSSHPRTKPKRITQIKNKNQNQTLKIRHANERYAIWGFCGLGIFRKDERYAIWGFCGFANQGNKWGGGSGRVATGTTSSRSSLCSGTVDAGKLMILGLLGGWLWPSPLQIQRLVVEGIWDLWFPIWKKEKDGIYVAEGSGDLGFWIFGVVVDEQ